MTIIASLLLVATAAGACDLPLPSDLDRDCAVNFNDVLAMADQWLTERAAAVLR